MSRSNFNLKIKKQIRKILPNLEDMQPFTASELKGMLYDNGVTNTTTTQLGGLIKKFARNDGYGNWKLKADWRNILEKENSNS